MQERFFLGQSALGFHRISYTEFNGGSEKPPVICVHGVTRNGRDFDILAEALAKQGRTVYCPDMAGRGKSDWLKNPFLYNFPQYMADLTAMIARTNAPQIDWVGTSMGGMLGMLMAAQPKSPIRRIVLNDVGPSMAASAFKRIGEYIGEAVIFKSPAEAEQYIRKIYAPFGILTDADWKSITETSLRRLPKGEYSLAHDPALGNAIKEIKEDVDLWTFYDIIKIPTLLVRGGMSDLLSEETAVSMTERGPMAKLVTFEDCGHAPSLRTPRQIQSIAEFLA